jgi:general secretion pathway protein D
MLKISQEISSIAQSAEGAVDLITNERIIETTVIVEDGGILVLGGLIEDVLRESDQRVPILGSIPIVGALFRSRTTNKMKTNLMIFIRPKILRSGVQTAFATHEKYNMIRDVQQAAFGPSGGNVQLMRGVDRPILPPIEDVISQQQAIDLRGLADKNTDSETDAESDAETDAETDAESDAQQ